jgi:hypothetical protein
LRYAASAMKTSWPYGALVGVTKTPAFFILSSLASVACTTDEGGTGNVPAANQSATDDSERVPSGTGGSPEVSPNTPIDNSGNGGTVTGPEMPASTPVGGGTATVAVGAGGSGGTGSPNVGGSASLGGAPSGGGGTSAGGAGIPSAGASGAAVGGAGPAGGSGGGAGASADTVTRTDSTFTFQHYPIETGTTGVWTGSMTPLAQATSTTYDTLILENGYLKVTLLPGYGGRILSIVHKPTNTELLYQNPVGAPYLMYEDIFYYDYLVIMGGIFPSFPEPEHGRHWNQPYDLEVVSESPEAITVRMSRIDELDLVEGIPERYEVPRTDVLVELEVTLRAGSTAVELDTKLTNTRSEVSPAFEYWTVTTLAPGSVPGETAIPRNTRILASMDQVRLLESSWAWFGEAEERVDGEVFTWNNLSYFENWDDQGTAFANPSYTANWSGLVNYDNDRGVLRVSDNVETPGLKLWTFGTQSLDVDLSDPNDWLRPTIEMWHGITPEFWMRDTMAASEVRQWTDHFVPTLGLREVTAANRYGAVQLSSSEAGADRVLSATATLTLPDQTVNARLKLDGTVVAEQDVVVVASEATVVSITMPSAEASPGAVFEVEFAQGDAVLLAAQAAIQ